MRAILAAAASAALAAGCTSVSTVRLQPETVEVGRGLRPVAAIDLLINDDTNPRAIAFQVEAIKELLDRLPAAESSLSLGPDQRIAETLIYRIRMSDPNEMGREESGCRRLLERMLEQLIDDLPRLSNAITARYLIHTGTAQELTGRVDTIVHDTSPDSKNS